MSGENEAIIERLRSYADYQKSRAMEKDINTLESNLAELEKELEDIGIQEICQWIIDKYPPDVFIGEGGSTGAILIAGLRDHAVEILRFRKEAAEAKEADDERRKE